MLEEALGRLLSAQTGRGAFASTVACGDVELADETCFVTAQVALILTDLAGACPAARERIDRARDRALDFVEACASEQVAGAFLFYPERIASPRLAIALVPDGDDTALAWLALMRGGRRSRALAQAVLPALFERLRTAAPQRGDPPWVRAGVHRTWFDPAGSRNPVDACVNANILAALAEAGCAGLAGLDRAAACIDAACRGADLSRSALRSLAPFYADVTELAIALDRAVGLGAAALEPAAAALRTAGFLGRDRAAGRPADRPLYCNAHGRPLWRSASLQLARRCHDLAFPTRERTQRHPSLASGGGDVLHV